MNHLSRCDVLKHILRVLHSIWRTWGHTSHMLYVKYWNTHTHTHTYIYIYIYIYICLCTTMKYAQSSGVWWLCIPHETSSNGFLAFITMICFKLYASPLITASSTFLCNFMLSGLSVRQWSGRPGFDPRSSHTKDFKNSTWYRLA